MDIPPSTFGSIISIKHQMFTKSQYISVKFYFSVASHPKILQFFVKPDILIWEIQSLYLWYISATIKAAQHTENSDCFLPSEPWDSHWGVRRKEDLKPAGTKLIQRLRGQSPGNQTLPPGGLSKLSPKARFPSGSFPHPHSQQQIDCLAQDMSKTDFAFTLLSTWP